jgi:hypothetical protein
MSAPQISKSTNLPGSSRRIALRKPFGIAGGRHPRERHVEVCHQSLHLLEVSQLFPRKLRHAHCERAIVRVGKNQTQRRRCGFLFAISMIDE